MWLLGFGVHSLFWADAFSLPYIYQFSSNDISVDFHLKCMLRLIQNSNSAYVDIASISAKVRRAPAVAPKRHLQLSGPPTSTTVVQCNPKCIGFTPKPDTRQRRWYHIRVHVKDIESAHRQQLLSRYAAGF